MHEEKDLCAAYARVFEGKAGAMVLRDIERMGMTRRTTFHPEAQRMAFNEGQRNLALYILRLADAENRLRQPEAAALRCEPARGK